MVKLEYEPSYVFYWGVPELKALSSRVIFIDYTILEEFIFALMFIIILWGLSLGIIFIVIYFAEFFV